MPDALLQAEQPTPYRNRSPEIKDLAAALVKVQATLEGAKKDAKAVITGSQTRTYADLASVWEAIRKPLTDNDLCVVQFPRTVGQGVEIETTLMHGKTGQFMSDALWVPCGKNDAQGLGSAITYGRRYALMAVVGVCPVDDDGAAAGSSHKPGVPGSAGGGGDFRPPGPRRMPTNNYSKDAEHDGIVDATRPKGTLPAKGVLGGRAPTAEEARAAKIKAATDLRINALKEKSDWTRDALDQLWKGNESWISWMSDPDNKALTEYQRFLDAFSEAEVNIRPVELA